MTRFSLVQILFICLLICGCAAGLQAEDRSLQQSILDLEARIAAYVPDARYKDDVFGLVVVKDASSVSLRDRAKFDQLVKAENADRNALYREIAKANGHPEWEPEVREVFAKQWVQQARSGWWVQNASGKWSKK